MTERKIFGGKVLFLDRSDINTDEIIPAKYLTEITKQAMGPHLLEDLSVPGFDPAIFKSPHGKSAYGAILSRSNFGCGSSREHAPWALEMNGITMVMASSFARIFRQNMFNCGMMAVELPEETIENLFSEFAGKETSVSVKFYSDALPVIDAAGGSEPEGKSPRGEITFRAEGAAKTVPFTLSPFAETLVKTGGWVEFADSRY